MNGQLLGGGELVSTETGLAYVPLAPSTEVGDITTTFALVQGDLVWLNSTFGHGGNAAYCLMGSTLEAVFTDTYPDNCTPASVGVVPGKLHIPTEIRKA